MTEAQKWKEAARIMAKTLAYALSTQELVEKQRLPELHKERAFEDVMTKVRTAKDEISKVVPDAFVSEFLYPARRA